MTVQEIIEALKKAKETEKQATQARIELETQLISQPEIAANLKQDGMTTFKEFGLSVTCGFNRKWDQEVLKKMSPNIKPDFFPFELVAEFKENKKHSGEIQEKYPELWVQLGKALTLTPKKPAVTVRD